MRQDRGDDERPPLCTLSSQGRTPPGRIMMGEAEMGTARILIVEDNDMNRDLLRRRLQRQQFEVLVAPDGYEALDIARSGAPDVILMDIGLPGIDGLETTRRLKADARTGHIPVIALTAHAMAGDEQTAIDAGCDDYDTKPIDMPRLLGKIQKAMERRS